MQRCRLRSAAAERACRAHPLPYPALWLCTAGGRVLCVSALGEDLGAARDRAYEACDRIHFDGAYRRSDIAWRELARQGQIRDRA